MCDSEPTSSAAAGASSTDGACPCVADGQWVLMLQSDGDRRLVRVRAGGTTKAGKLQVSVEPMIGAPFGANFRVEPSGLVRDVRTVEEITGSVGEVFSDVAPARPDATNAELFDDGNAQRLGEADIRRLKQKGTHGAELVKAIAASSATFAGKTAFAQDKYLRKKAKKHMPFVSVVRPSPLTLCDFYMHKCAAPRDATQHMTHRAVPRRAAPHTPHAPRCAIADADRLQWQFTSELRAEDRHES